MFYEVNEKKKGEFSESLTNFSAAYGLARKYKSYLTMIPKIMRKYKITFSKNQKLKIITYDKDH